MYGLGKGKFSCSLRGTASYKSFWGDKCKEILFIMLSLCILVFLPELGKKKKVGLAVRCELREVAL